MVNVSGLLDTPAVRHQAFNFAHLLLRTEGKQFAEMQFNVVMHLTEMIKQPKTRMSEGSSKLCFTGQEVLAILVEEEEDTHPYRCLHPCALLHTLEKQKELPTMNLGDNSRRRTTHLHHFSSGQL